MFCSISDFLYVWQYEADATLKLLHLLTDDSLQQRVSPDGRTLGRLANHLIETLTEMPHRVGLPVAEEQVAHDKASDIVASYERVNKNFVEALKQSWKDEDLKKEANMYGEVWKNGSTLFILVTHQAHHRGQMTVLMRRAGLKVIGVYGPAKEEWLQMNMEPMV
ncbi:MAG TPA: DinB family protein [Flavipsychrobacter sp.]|nr:DinB family protein [Flavipsychrobacter sp.]